MLAVTEEKGNLQGIQKKASSVCWGLCVWRWCLRSRGRTEGEMGGPGLRKTLLSPCVNPSQVGLTSESLVMGLNKHRSLSPFNLGFWLCRYEIILPSINTFPNHHIIFQHPYSSGTEHVTLTLKHNTIRQWTRNLSQWLAIKSHTIQHSLRPQLWKRKGVFFWTTVFFSYTWNSKGAENIFADKNSETNTRSVPGKEISL